MSPELEALVHPVELIAEVRDRLVMGGGVRELQHLRGFSSSELSILVHQEIFRGWRA